MPPMSDTSTPKSAATAPTAELPDRLCTWCKVAMTKIAWSPPATVHYTRPSASFSTIKRTPQAV